jgi:hypothetical protein
MYEIASFYTRDKPQRRGKYHFIKSPFNLDKTPSCCLYEKSFKDYSSGKAGDLIKFVAYLFNIGNKEAVLKIAIDFKLPININEKIDTKKLRFYIKKENELEQTSQEVNYHLNKLYNKLCLLYRCYRDLLKVANDIKTNKFSLVYQEIRFNYDFFDRYSEIMATADMGKQIDYIINIQKYYDTELRWFLK